MHRDRTGLSRVGTRIRALCRKLVLTGLLLGAPAAAAESLRYPFVLPATGVEQAPGPISCGTFAPPMVDMSGLFSFYAAGASQSVVDREKMAAYLARVRPSEDVKGLLTRLQQRWLDMPPRRRALAQCMATQIIDWARANALLEGIDTNDRVGRRQAGLIIAWTSISFVNAWQIVQGTPGLVSAEDNALVRGWFERLAGAIKAEFWGLGDLPTRLRWLSMVSNHSHWAAASLGHLAVATGNRAALDAAMAELERAVRHAEPNGALPVELRRGQRGLHYQSFAMEAIGLLVRLADANGRALSASDESRLTAITRFTTRLWEDPEAMAPYGPVEQERKPKLKIYSEVLLEHFARRDPGLAAQLDCLAASVRPLVWDFVSLPLSARVGSAGRGTCAR